MSITSLNKLVGHLQEILGDTYVVAYRNNTILFLIKEHEDRNSKRDEFLKLIQSLNPEIKQFHFDVYYEEEAETGVTYKVEIVKELNVAFNNVATFTKSQNEITATVQGVHNQTLEAVAKEVAKQIFVNVIHSHPSRQNDIKFRIRYIGGGFSFTVTKDNSLVLESLDFIDYVEFLIVSDLSSKPLNNYNTITYIKDISKDSYIFALENLVEKGIVDAQDFHPNAIVTGHGGAPNYPDIFQVKLLKTDFAKYL